MIKCVVEFLVHEDNIKDKEQFEYMLAEATEYLHSNGILEDFNVKEYSTIVTETTKEKP